MPRAFGCAVGTGTALEHVTHPEDLLLTDDTDPRTRRLRTRLGLRPHGVDVEARLIDRSADGTLDDGALLHLATRGDDVVLRGSAGLITALSIARGRRQTPLQVWCAGAGGLAEPLSLLVLAAAAGIDVDVVASDVAADACEDARATHVVGHRVALLPGRLARFFTTGTRGHDIDVGLLRRLRVAHGDLRVHAPSGPFDVVICREVAHHYRPEIAREMMARLRASLDEDGILVVSIVDALAVGLPIADDGAGVVVVDKRGNVVARDHREVPAIWRLCELLDGEASVSDRTGRLRALSADDEADDDPGVATATAALLYGDGHLKDARAAAGDDDNGDVVRALCDRREGRFSDARGRLEHVLRRSPTSWVASYLLGDVARRTSREAEGRGLFRTTIELLDGAGAPAGELAALVPELDPRHVHRSCGEVLREQKNLWHRG